MKELWKYALATLSPALTAVALLAFILAGLPPRAAALPSYARQTGLPCSRCHITFPELTEFGREFKLNGYTLTATDSPHVTANDKGREAGLWLNQNLPVSVMFQIADSVLNKTAPGSQNGTVEFPQQFSLFLAGALTDHIGSFIQATYTGTDNHFGLDNTDLRYANFRQIGGKQLVYGLDLNNNPTVEDLWNSTPAWGFPWASSDSAPSPAAAALIDGGLAQDVGGAGAYALFDHHWYGALFGYRSMHLGGPVPVNGTGFDVNITGTAPYWRGAWQANWNKGKDYLELGFYGLHANTVPNAVAGLRNRYFDQAVDFQQEHRFGRDLLTTHGTCIYQRSTLDAFVAAGSASNPKDVLRTCRADSIYHFGTRVSLGAGGFGTWGTADPLLFAPAATSGSASGKPTSSGYQVQVGYWVRQNVELSASWRGYLRFNGGTTNYDGSGRNASQNDTIYLNAWLMF